VCVCSNRSALCICMSCGHYSSVYKHSSLVACNAVWTGKRSVCTSPHGVTTRLSLSLTQAVGMTYMQTAAVTGCPGGCRLARRLSCRVRRQNKRTLYIACFTATFDYGHFVFFCLSGTLNSHAILIVTEYALHVPSLNNRYHMSRFMAL
jgi:hypothetical protein